MCLFLNWLIPTVDAFPRSQRFLLGDRIQNTALDVLEEIVWAIYLSEERLVVRRMRRPVAGASPARITARPARRQLEK